MNPIVLSWTNETSLTPYPLVRSFKFDSFIIDANFIQFDSFIPTLSSVQLIDDTIQLTLIFDELTKIVTYTISEIITPGTTKVIRHNDRYLGALTFGTGVGKFVAVTGNQTILKVNTPFIASTVRSIPSKAGVYTINNKYGDLDITSDSYVSYVVDGDEITFNAVHYPTLSSEPFLKTLNSIGPTDNSVFIKNTDIIKVAGNSSTISISLVGTSLNSLTKANAIIVTTDGGAS